MRIQINHAYGSKAETVKSKWKQTKPKKKKKQNKTKKIKKEQPPSQATQIRES